MDPLNAQQEAIVEFMGGHSAGLVFAPPGTGKTRAILTAIEKRVVAGQIKTAVIFAPLRVTQEVWPAEIKKWNIKLTHTILHGKTKDKALKEDVQLYLINFDGLQWLIDSGKRFDALIVDESTCLKNTTTKRFKMMKKWAHLFKYRYGTTGTPVPNGLLNLFGQTFITVGDVLGRNITHYRTTYFFPSGYGGYDWRLQPGADALIYKALEQHCVLIEKTDFPFGVKKSDVKFSLPPRVLKTYRELEREFIAELDCGSIEVLSAAALSIKLRQYTSGVVASDAGDLDIHTARMDALRELLSELDGQQVLIFYNFNTELAQLKKEFGKNLVVISGGLTQKQFKDVLTAWNSGEVQYLAVQPQAGGHGLNLQEGGAYTYIWYSLTFDLEVYLQACARLARTGQQNDTVFGYHLIAAETIDERIAEVLARKDGVQAGMLSALRDYYQTPNVNGITAHYAKLNAQLHKDRDKYGTHGKDWAAEVRYLKALLDVTYGDVSVLDFGCGKGTLADALAPDVGVYQYDPGIAAHLDFDWRNCAGKLVSCTDVLEHVEPRALESVVKGLVDFILRAGGAGFFVIGLKPSKKILPDGRNSHLSLMDPEEWLSLFSKYFNGGVVYNSFVKGPNLVLTVCSPQSNISYVDLLTISETLECEQYRKP